MKLTTLLLTVNLLHIGATTYSQSNRVSLVMDQKSVKEALSAIEEQSTYKFVYRDKDIEDKQVTIKTENEPIDVVLASLLSNTGMNYQILENNLIVIAPSKEIQQTKINGSVVDQTTNEPLVGVSISIEGTTLGTMTDANGKFSIDVPNANASLVFSYMGYTQQTVKLAGQTTLTISMVSEAKAIDEVVVVGYGTQRKANLTGAANRLSESDMNKATSTSPIEMMQGRISGVNISQNNGEPGGGMTVRVRGSSSIRSGQDPLYVIDGVPLDNSNLTPAGNSTTSGITGSASTNALNFLNPDDIESIDILKDASSTAIYGARGANGVIFVTTKKGKKGQGVLTYDGYMGVSSIRKKLDVLSASQFRAYRKPDGTALTDMGASNNWQDLIFRDAITQSHTVTYSGGTERGTYRASLGYLNQDGIVKTTTLEKLNGKIQVSQKLFNDHLNITGNIIVSHAKDRRAPIGETGGFEGDVILTALKLNPTYPIYNADGSYYQNSTTQRNPLAMLNLTNDITATDHLIGNLSAEYEIIKGLKYKINLGWDRTVAERRINLNKDLTYLVNHGECNINEVAATNKLVENYLTYSKSFGNHNFTFLAGQAYQNFMYTTSLLNVNNFTVEDILYTSNLGYGNNSTATASSSASENELQSFFGRLNYDFKNRYLLTFTLRADGSSKFGPNNKYGYFPSTALAWRLSDEDFLKSIEAINNLKLRVGWGQTGNQEIPPKMSELAVGTATDANGMFNNTLSPGITFINTPNPDIKWETTTQTDVGIDFGLFRDRLSGTVDYFHKETTNVLLYATAASPAPTSNVWENVPGLKIINDGIEVGLNGVLIRSKDLNWEAGLNYSKIKNNVKNLPVTRLYTGAASGQGLSGTSVQVITNNEPIGTFYGRVFEGFDSNGMSIYKKDAQGNDAMEYLGTALPDYTYSFTTKVEFKNFDLSMFWYGTHGNKVYNNTANALFVKGSLNSGSNVTTEVANSSESPSNGNTFSSRFIEDGSFLRLSNLTLGYNFNVKSMKWISMARIYVTGNNLMLITKYKGFDPEVNADASQNGIPSLGINYTNYPKARTFTFGISLKF